MSLYECKGCGKRTEFDDECCGRLMKRRGGELVCTGCGNKIEMPTCCGEEMMRVGL